MVVALWSPSRPETMTVKRIIAVEGDEVLTKRPYPLERVIVPLGHIWVEGDHPEGRKSLDSNTYGPVAVSMIVGQVRGIVWPWSKVGRVSWRDWGGARGRVREGRITFKHIPPPI